MKRMPLPILLLILFLVLAIALSMWRYNRPPRPAQAAGPLAPIPYVQKTDDGKTVVTARVDPKTGMAKVNLPKDKLKHLERIELRKVNPDGSQTVVGTINPADLKRGEK